jgi:hypothetical protein
MKLSKLVQDIADEIEMHWEGPTEFKGEVPEWDGPSGMSWCQDKKKYVHPEKCDCPECQAITQVDIKPERYLHPTDISW